MCSSAQLSCEVVDASDESVGVGVRLKGPGDDGFTPFCGKRWDMISFSPEDAEDTMDGVGDLRQMMGECRRFGGGDGDC